MKAVLRAGVSCLGSVASSTSSRKRVAGIDRRKANSLLGRDTHASMISVTTANSLTMSNVVEVKCPARYAVRPGMPSKENFHNGRVKSSCRARRWFSLSSYIMAREGDGLGLMQGSSLFCHIPTLKCSNALMCPGFARLRGILRNCLRTHEFDVGSHA